MIQVNVRYGSDSFSRTYPEGATVGDVLNDQDLKITAGWTDNVRGLIGGTPQASTTRLANGSTVVVETQANDKAN